MSGFLEAFYAAVKAVHANKMRSALTALGWTPRFVSLDEIVRTAWTWRDAHPRGYAG